MERIDIRVEGEKKEFWQEFADAHGMSLTDLIRRGVEAYINSGPGRDSSVYVPREKPKVVTDEEVEDKFEEIRAKEEAIKSKWSGKPMFKDDKMNKEAAG